MNEWMVAWSASVGWSPIIALIYCLLFDLGDDKRGDRFGVAGAA
jgi:hypothetical protein